MPGWLLALFILGAVWGLTVWRRAWPELPSVTGEASGADAMMCRYQLPDFIFAGCLAGFFLFMILGASGEAPPVTRQVLLNGIAFYLSLVTALLSFLLLRGLSPGEIFGLGRKRIPSAAKAPPPNPLQRLFSSSAEPAEAAQRPNQELSSENNAAAEVVAGEPSSAPTLSADFMRGVVLFAAAYPLIILIQLISYALMADQAQSQDIVRFLVEQATWGDRLAVLALALVVAPLAEEVVFRGYLYGVVRKLGGRWCAIGTTSLIFAAIHLHLPSMAALFFLGVVLCLIYEITRRLWIPFVLHGVFNGISAVVALVWPELVS